jgi:methylated-DNA-[protein]-cysteine S-methyltransferase
MPKLAYCLFETPLGSCGIAWREYERSRTPPRVTFLQFPEATAKITESRIARHSGARKSSAPPPHITEVMERICRHLRGDVQDFRDIAVDVDGAGRFARQVYEAAREIPAGETRTYGELAHALSRPTAARAVGQALGRNPIGLIIPCHRVLASGGELGGFSAHGGRATKARLLAIERKDTIVPREHDQDASARYMLRHSVATLAYRAGKALRGVPDGFAELRISATARSSGEILAHIGDLLDWALSLARGTSMWHSSAPLSWEAGVKRFFAALKAFDAYLASGDPLAASPEKLFQGPIADALTHVGQLATRRHVAGTPVRGENYFLADIVVGRVGLEQSEPRREFD